MESVLTTLGTILAAIVVDVFKAYLSRHDEKAEALKSEETPAADNPDLRDRLLKRVHERQAKAGDIQS